MHPAYSVIFFTTASGAGFGLLALLGVLAAAGLLHPDLWLGIMGFGLAFGLITTGLLSSTAHLGRKERAWRAFSQWRSSWLSREGVLACATVTLGCLFAAGWVVLGRIDSWILVAGLVAAIGSALTVYSTAMIYASLKPIAQWHNGRTVGSYLLFSAMSGLVLLVALMRTTRLEPMLWFALASILLTVVGFVWKVRAWWCNDRLAMPATINAATGLSGGCVTSIEWPHTEENYLLKEMGFRVARKHRERLRVIASAFAFALPVAFLTMSLAVPGPASAAWLSILAAASQFAGLLVERWLFFAEAKHTVTLYYGRM